MESGTSRLFAEGPSQVSTERLDTQNFIGFGTIDLPPVSDPATRSSITGTNTSNSAFSGQDGLNMSLFPTSSTNSSASLPATASSTDSTLLGQNQTTAITGSGDGIFSSPPNMFGESLIMPYADPFISIGNEWQSFQQGFPVTDVQRRSFHSQVASRGAASYPYPGNRRLQYMNTNQAQMLRPLGPHTGMSQYQVMSQGPMNAPIQTGTQTSPAIGGFHAFPQSPGLSNYMPSRRQAASLATAQRRRHSRASSRTSLAGNTQSVTGVNSPRGSRSHRRRSRGSDSAITQTPGRSPATQVPLIPPPNDPSGPSGQHYPGINMQQRVDVARRLNYESDRLREMIQRIRTEDAHALAYEQTFLRRFHDDLDTMESPSPPKGLDNQNDGRPEPKETEDMNVNLECRICMSQVVDTVLLPCGHAILCRWCAAQHMPNQGRLYPKERWTCPICRSPVKHK
ncbi:C3HC4 finger protein, partial [Aspergillus sclerotialis]